MELLFIGVTAAVIFIINIIYLKRVTALEKEVKDQSESIEAMLEMKERMVELMEEMVNED